MDLSMTAGPTSTSATIAQPPTGSSKGSLNHHRMDLAESPKRSDSNSHAAPTQPARSASTSVSGLNPRSCVRCQRRKVRCNKENPCSRCAGSNIECIFPCPGDAPRRARKPPGGPLARLKRLEELVATLGVDNGSDGRARDKVTASLPQPNKSDYGQLEARFDQEKRYGIDKHLGRLVVNEDRSRYFSNQLWVSMGDGIAEMRDLLGASSLAEEEPLDEYRPLAQDPCISHEGFLFGYSSLKVDLKSLHPSPSQIFILWEVYRETVDPVVKLIHRPTCRNILLNAARSTDNITRVAEALLFSIYYGAITSLTQEQCRKLLDEDRHELIKRYRFATEQALARADFLNSSSLMCLQAFVAFLVFVRKTNDSRIGWALSGLAIQIARALGIHRDGSHFGLPPFDIEMRRRLWWHILILDNRSSEDHGTDPTFSDQIDDTKLPLNVNDEEIWPGMAEPPTERPGATEMTFSLVRFELSVVNRRLNITGPGVGDLRNRAEGGSSARDQTLHEQEDMIDRCRCRVEEQYLQHCDMSKPILWVTATVARLILAKMWLAAHHPRGYLNDGDAPPPEVRDRLFVTSVEVIELSYVLERNETTAKWGWLFRSYMQWQSVAFVLSEIICTRSWTPEAERAWRAVEIVHDVHFIQPDAHHRGMLWKPMRALWRKAQLARQQHMRSHGQMQVSQGDLASGCWNNNLHSQQQEQQKDSSKDLGLIGGQPADYWTGNWIANNDIAEEVAAAAFGLDLSNMLTPESLSWGLDAATNRGMSKQVVPPRITRAPSIPTVRSISTGVQSSDTKLGAGTFSPGQSHNVSYYRRNSRADINPATSATAAAQVAAMRCHTMPPDRRMDLDDTIDVGMDDYLTKNSREDLMHQDLLQLGWLESWCW